jgi:topoisomerase-4 subunit B
LSQGAKIFYARDDAHKAALLSKEFNGKGKVDVSRFKGLGEMLPKQLKETTMDPKARMLLKVEIADDDKSTGKVVDQLMGNKPEARFRFIQERAEFAKAEELDI